MNYAGPTSYLHGIRPDTPPGLLDKIVVAPPHTFPQQLPSPPRSPGCSQDKIPPQTLRSQLPPSPPHSPDPYSQIRTTGVPPQPACYPHPLSPPQPLPLRYRPVAPEDRLGSILGGYFRLDEVLGSGAYGVVYTATHIVTNVKYAVKTLPNYNADGQPLDQRQTAFKNREIHLHWLASAHQNVVSMYHIIDDYDCTYVVLEYCPEGDLFYNITDCGRYIGDDALAKRVFLQLLDAVDFCHSRGIFHRDLKPENILVKDQGNTVKLADFGLATSSRVSEDYGCGSTFYMSPECLDQTSQRNSYLCAPNDVWSLGVILVNLTCGRNPWKQASAEDSTYRAYMRNPEFLKTILPVSDELNDILSMIFTRDPLMRITLRDLRQAIRNCAYLTRTPPSAQPMMDLSTQEDTIYDMEDAPDSPASDASDVFSDSSSDDIFSDSSSDHSSDAYSDVSDMDESWEIPATPSQLDGVDNHDRPEGFVVPKNPSQPVGTRQHPVPLAQPNLVSLSPQAVPCPQVPHPLPNLQPMGAIPQGPCAPQSTLGFPYQIWDMVKPFLPAAQPSAFHHQLAFHPVSLPVPGLGF